MTAGLVTWLLNFITTTLRDSKKRRHEAKYFALRIALSLERFGLACASAIADDVAWDASNKSAGARLTELPPLNFDVDIDWLALDSELVEETLLLPSDIEHGNGSIDFASEMWIEPDDFTEGVDQAGLCGYRAVLVADRLRIKYQLPTYRKLTSQWDFRAVLEEYHDKKLANYEAMSKYA